MQPLLAAQRLGRHAQLVEVVAIPLPGTGAWTGSLVAAVFDIRLKHAFPVIALGVLIAGIIVSAVTYGVSIFL